MAEQSKSKVNPEKEKLDTLMMLQDFAKKQHETQLNPYQQGVMKGLIKAGQEHATEALQQGVPSEHIVQQSGVALSPVQQQASDLVQPKGFLGRWQDNFTKMEGGVTTADKLDNLVKAQKIMGGQNNPEQAAKMIAEAQKIAPEGYQPIMNTDGEIYFKPSDSTSRASASLQNAQDKRIESVIGTINESNTGRTTISNAINSVSKLESGLKGKVTYGVIKNLDANNPLLEDWQNLKIALTEAHLLTSQSLKGAISDVENKWLAAASANDNLISVPRAKSVLSKVKRALDSKEKSAVDSYKRIYKENPYDWAEGKSNMNDNDNLKNMSDDELRAIINAK